MPTAEATIATPRPGRYLTQLCRHVDRMGRHEPSGRAAAARVTWSEHDGRIDVGWATCVLQATGTTLALHVEAADDAHLQQLQTLLTERLEQFGRRDGLSVHWHPAQVDAADLRPIGTASPTGAPSTGRRQHRSAIVLIGIGVLAVAVHIGLVAAAVRVAPWTGWALDLVIAAVVLKLLVALVFGRRAVHRARSPRMHGRRAGG